jgi:hypothetical protein
MIHFNGLLERIPSMRRELGREGEAPAGPRTLPARHFNEMRSSL